MNFKKLMRKLHLWIGLPGAIMFFIICITGSIFTFADECIEFSGKEFATVSYTGEDWISIEQMQAKIDSAYSDNMQVALTLSKDKSRSAKFLIVYNKGLQDVYMNPYTGEILGVSRGTIGFFYIIGHLHSLLLWHGPGEWIVKIATLLFFIALISGLILWWPKRSSKTAMKNAFTYSRNKPFKRRVYDLHNVWGFYGLGILLLITGTGLILSFKPLANTVSYAAGGDPTQDIRDYAPDSTKTMVDMRPVLKDFLNQPGIKVAKVAFLYQKQSGVMPVQVGTKMNILTFKGNVHLLDKYTGKEIINPGITRNFETSNTLMNLHTGKYWGWGGLILTFLAGLLGAFLSVTGVMLWLQKL